MDPPPQPISSTGPVVPDRVSRKKCFKAPVVSEIIDGSNSIDRSLSAVSLFRVFYSGQFPDSEAGNAGAPENGNRHTGQNVRRVVNLEIDPGGPHRRRQGHGDRTDPPPSDSQRKSANNQEKTKTKGRGLGGVAAGE